MRPASARFANFRQLGDFRWCWPHFRPYEMRCRGNDELLVVPTFMDWLEGVRHVYGQGMVITSGYRTPGHQATLPGARRTGAHDDGIAVDVLVSGEDAFRLIKIAMGQGAAGIGVQQKGAHEKRYLHLDMWTKAPEGVRPRVWSY